jgi:1-acyl-sn-glycerol-3-phosphate acyltransferase
MWQTDLLNGTGRNVARCYARLALKLDVQYLAPLPAGAKIIAANHPTTTDPFLMMGWSGEPIHILITEMCFQMPVLGRFLRAAGHIPVVTGNGRAAFAAALELLREGKTVGIFPEGALSPLQGGVGTAHTGTARLALASGAPIVPAGIALQREHILWREARAGAQVETARIYCGGPYAVTTGLPLFLSGDLTDRAHVRQAVQRIMGHIMELAQASALRLRAARAAGAGPNDRPVLEPAFSRP